MTRFFSSSLALPFALAVALSTAGGIALFTSEARAAEAHPISVRCFMGATPGAKHDPTGGWICTTEQRNTEAQ
ncbi:MAG: hypothetical protein ABSC72_12425 [Methylovirgula sp.]|jgi:hypothetical protein